MSKINIGDLVKLKSGGQEMIVKQFCRIGDKIDKTMVQCAWQNLLGDPIEEIYPTKGLIKIS